MSNIHQPVIFNEVKGDDSFLIVDFPNVEYTDSASNKAIINMSSNENPMYPQGNANGFTDSTNFEDMRAELSAMART